ncbi:MAG: type II asparaginase [Phycisphaerales bacterium]|nr:type II asparaginase [Phycisphaerales bacterium]
MLVLCAAGSAIGQPTPNPSSTAPATANQLPRVTILATGGTIAGKANTNSAVGYTSGQASAQDLIDAVPGIEKVATLTAEQISNIGSQDMNDEVWVALAKRINELFAKGDTDGVVITHGTDTMEETAFFLEQVLASDKPVVLVGSMRPSTAISADGPANLYAGVQVASSKEARGRGVLIVLNNTIHESRDATKTHTTSLQTFASPNAGPAGYVDASEVRFVEPVETCKRPRFKAPDKAPLPRVDIIYSHSNMLPDEVSDALKRGCKGIVLAGVGDGNSSKAVVDALSSAAQQGTVVVRSSRVGAGFTVRNAELNDDKLGFIAAQDLNPPKARILLQLLLANGTTDAQRIQAEFTTR